MVFVGAQKIIGCTKVRRTLFVFTNCNAEILIIDCQAILTANKKNCESFKLQ